MVIQNSVLAPYIIIAACMLCLAGLGGYFVQAHYVSNDVPRDLAECLKDGGHPDIACARSAIHVLLETQSASEVVRSIEKDHPYSCHVIGHVVGQETYKRADSAEEAFAQCSPASCVEACIHGAAGEAFSEALGVSDDLEWRHPSMDLLRSEGSRLCEQPQACHGIGHMVYLFTSDLMKALTTCDAFGDGYIDDCYRGVFMEYGNQTMGRSYDVDALKPAGARKSVLSPCDTVEEKYQPSCFRFLYLYAGDEEHGGASVDFDSLAVACATVDAPRSALKCFRSAGWALYYTRDSVEDSYARCASISTEEYRAACAFGVSESYAEYGYSSMTIHDACARLSSREFSNGCYQGLFFALKARSEELSQICQDDICKAALVNMTQSDKGF